MKRYIFAVFAVLMLFCCGCGGESKKNEESSTAMSLPESSLDASQDTSPESKESGRNAVRYISQEEAASIMDSEIGYIILDVRTEEEFKEGHIPGAVCVPNETITDTMPPELPDKDQLILIYCRSGNRSKQAAKKLYDIGYNNLVEFGGIRDWQGSVVTD